MRLADTIGRFASRVEIAIAGVDDRLREAEEALARGDAMRARAAVHAVLAVVPGSPVALALLADACEAAGLDAEAHLTLEELALRAPSRAEVWLRLGRARQRTAPSGEDVRDAFVRALAVAEPGSEERTAALVELADLDLRAGDGPRAELWLERAPADKSAARAIRRAEARLLQGDARGAIARLREVEIDPTDARATLTLGRALAQTRDAGAFAPLVRAWVLDAPGASEALSSALAWIPSDVATRARVLTVAEAKGEAGLARWRAAFARAEGKRDEARRALADAVSSGDRTAARPLLDAALDDGDDASIAIALGALDDAHDAEVEDARVIVATTSDAGAAAKLDDLRRVGSPRVRAFARKRTREVLAQWVPPLGEGRRASWDALLARLDAHARELHDLSAMSSIASLARERVRPVRLAIVGEFNAGKSTFINALVGADVAPTGVLPTTATLHLLRYGPDPIARIALADTAGDGPKERIVPSADLRAALKSIDPSNVERVEILQPIAFLTRVEILDTPGFNAPDERHTRAARGAFEDADVLVWLLDASQPLKQSERTILEEAKAHALPVQMLVNKADRLAPDEVARVLEMVRAALDEVGITSLAPPIALSARLALAGKLGDEAARAASGWASVETLLEENIVARSDALKERALRRRCAKVVNALSVAVAHEAESEDATRAAADRARRDLAEAAARIDADGAKIAARIAEELPRDALAKDLALVVTGRDEARIATDEVLARYRVERAVFHLAGPLASALARETSSASATLGANAWRTIARASVRAAALAATDDVLASAASRAALASMVEDLGARAIAPSSPPRARGLAAELEELSALL
jgi:GTP-binding protein EngB required for normal cell division